MFPSKHIIYSFIFCLFLLIILPYGNYLYLLIIFLSSVLIDIDHYLLYVYRNKNLSLIKSWRWHIYLHNNLKESKIPFLHIFHTFEFIFLVFVLSLFYKIFIWIFIGLIFHVILDLYDMRKRKLYNQREWFLIKALLKR